MKTLSSSILRKCISSFLIILMLLHTVGCQTFFKFRQVPGEDKVSIQNIGEIHKYFLVHTGDDICSLKEIAVDSTNISGTLELAEHSSIYYYEGRKFHYKEDENHILNEVHIYLNEDADKLKLGQSDIPLTSIKEIRIIEKDTGKTTVSYIFGSIGGIFGFLAIFLIIVALTKSSCPYVYVNDGEGYKFEGEIFGGAIAKNLARDDYMPLPSIKANNGNYHIRISNELKERQYTDLAQLIVVNHPKGQKVLLDKSGQPQTLGSLKSAVQASSFNGEDIRSVLESKDKKVFFFNNKDYSKNGVILTFKKPKHIKKGKLVLNGKNTLWLDYLYGEVIKKLGGSYEEWMDQEEKIPTSERFQKVLDNDYPIAVYIKKSGEWKLIDHLFTVGPLASRDFVVPVDISELTGKEIEIKLETGFMFWELDYVAMDFTENSEPKVSIVKPSMALGTGSIDWTSALNKTDGNYMAQENVGEVTEIIFNTTPPLSDQKQTVFLHTHGYYELIRDFKGIPKTSDLKKFKEPGYFSDYSRSRYLKMFDIEDKVASNKANY